VAGYGGDRSDPHLGYRPASRGLDSWIYRDQPGPSRPARPPTTSGPPQTAPPHGPQPSPHMRMQAIGVVRSTRPPARRLPPASASPRKRPRPAEPLIAGAQLLADLRQAEVAVVDALYIQGHVFGARSERPAGDPCSSAGLRSRSAAIRAWEAREGAEQRGELRRGPGQCDGLRVLQEGRHLDQGRRCGWRRRAAIAGSRPGGQAGRGDERPGQFGGRHLVCDGTLGALQRVAHGD